MLNLIWFHRFLIACGAIFCAGFAAFQLKAFIELGGTGKLLLASLFAVLAVGLLWYLRNLRRFLRIP